MTSAIEFFSRSNPHTPQTDLGFEKPIDGDRFEDIFDREIEDRPERPERPDARRETDRAERNDYDRDDEYDRNNERELHRDGRDIPQDEDVPQGLDEAPIEKSSGLPAADQSYAQKVVLTDDTNSPQVPTESPSLVPTVTPIESPANLQADDALVSASEPTPLIDELVVTPTPEQLASAAVQPQSGLKEPGAGNGQPVQTESPRTQPVIGTEGVPRSVSELIAEMKGTTQAQTMSNETAPAPLNRGEQTQGKLDPLAGPILPAEANATAQAVTQSLQTGAANTATPEKTVLPSAVVPQQTVTGKVPGGDGKPHTVIPQTTQVSAQDADVDLVSIATDEARPRPEAVGLSKTVKPQTPNTASAPQMTQVPGAPTLPPQAEPLAQAPLSPAPAPVAESAAPGQLSLLQGAQPLSIEEPVLPIAKPDGASLSNGRNADVSTLARAHVSTPATLQSDLALAMSRSLRDGITRFEIQMDPPDLGRIEVQMELSKDGRVQAILSADNQETLDLLQRDQKHLHKALQDSGLDLDQDSLSFSLNDERGGEDRRGEHDEGLPNVILDHEDGVTHLAEIVGEPLVSESYGFRTRTETGISIRV